MKQSGRRVAFVLLVAVVALVLAYNFVGYYYYGGACWLGGRGMLLGLTGPLSGHHPAWSTAAFLLGLIMTLVALYMLLDLRRSKANQDLDPHCSVCSRLIDPGWSICPYCGKAPQQTEPPGGSGGGL
jgi:uncharacterized membrane protein